MVNQQIVSQQHQPFNSSNVSSGIDDMTRQRYLEEEKERLRQYEEQRRAGGQGPVGGAAAFNPFAAQAPVPQQPDLVNFFDTPAAPLQQQQTSAAAPSNNPFASFGAPPPAPPSQPSGSSFFLICVSIEGLQLKPAE